MQPCNCCTPCNHNNQLINTHNVPVHHPHREGNSPSVATLEARSMVTDRKQCCKESQRAHLCNVSFKLGLFGPYTHADRPTFQLDHLSHAMITQAAGIRGHCFKARRRARRSRIASRARRTGAAARVRATSCRVARSAARVFAATFRGTIVPRSPSSAGAVRVQQKGQVERPR